MTQRRTPAPANRPPRCGCGNSGAYAAGTLAETYLAARGVAWLAASPALRFRGDTPHPEGGALPAVIALVQDMSGAGVAVHRTYLAADGQAKANIEPQKASLGPVWGGAIRLADARPDTPLVIGEGIETSASAGRLIGAPAWAAISAGNLGKGLILRPDIRDIIIAVDPDPAGEKAASQAAARWQAEGRAVRLARPSDGLDFNDILRNGAEGGAHG